MIIRKYEELHKYINAFSKENISLLIVKSVGGLGKSYTTQQALKDTDCIFFNGHATPLSIYLRLVANPDKLVVFDDVDSLLNNKVNIALLKQLCEIKKDKTIRYDSTSKVKGEDIPPSFVSNNKVCLLCNDLKRIGKDIGALWTRGVMIDFIPCKKEVLNVIKHITGLDSEIFGYLQESKSKLSAINIRLYLKLVELKTSGINWKDYLHSYFKLPADVEIAKSLMHLCAVERDLEWEARTGKTARTLQRVLKKIKESEK